MPLKKATGGFHPVPGYSVFYQVPTRMDPEAFASRLTDWLQGQSGTLPQALALDGKMIRHPIGLLTLTQQEDDAPQAVAVYDQKRGTVRCEQNAAVALLEKLPALDWQNHHRRPVALPAAPGPSHRRKRGRLLIRDQGKPASLAPRGASLGRLARHPLFTENQTGHGRVETRQLHAFPLSLLSERLDEQFFPQFRERLLSSPKQCLPILAAA
nr:hypothetical protein [Verrucomicrobium sp. 3C]